MGGPFAVTNLMPGELLNTGYQACTTNADGGMSCCANGPHWGGFEVTGAILMSTSFYRTQLLSDMECGRTGGMHPNHIMSMSDVFTAIGGIFDDSFGAQQLAPTVDADYTLQ